MALGVAGDVGVGLDELFVHAAEETATAATTISVRAALERCDTATSSGDARMGPGA
jgi:hypothetical protein